MTQLSKTQEKIIIRKAVEFIRREWETASPLRRLWWRIQFWAEVHNPFTKAKPTQGDRKEEDGTER